MFDRHIPRRGPAPQVMTGGDGSGTKGSRTYSVATDVGIVSSTWECDYLHSDSTWPPSRSYWRKIVCRIARDAVDRGRTDRHAPRLARPFAAWPCERCTVGAPRSWAATSTRVDSLSRPSSGGTSATAWQPSPAALLG